MRALILVDIQRDFCAGGALAVPKGDEVVSVANELLGMDYALRVATRDWHPKDHESFASQHAGRKVGEKISLHGKQQILWPDHCVQYTTGAAFHDNLNHDRIQAVFDKGQDRRFDSYSGFGDVGGNRTGLGRYIREHGIQELDILGLATDYCVLETALEARKLGFRVWVVTPGCRAVDLTPGDGDRALERMKAAGVQLVL